MSKIADKAILKAFNSGTFLADVQIIGSLPRFLKAIPTSRAIAATDMIAGRKVAVLFLDPNNHKDAVVIAVYT